MNHRILMIGKRNGETLSIKNELSQGNRFRVDVASTAQDAVRRITTSTMNLVVFNLDTFTQDKIKLATDLRDLGYGFPVLVLSKIVAPDTFNEFDDMYQTVLLEKPFENKDLVGLADKLVHGNPVQQRYHRRFYTNQKAKMYSFSESQEYSGKLYNLSRGGAYIESDDVTFSKGDLLRVNVPLQDVQRHYDLDARVVWTTECGEWAGKKGVGVEFVKGSDIYRNLLSKF